MAEINAGNQAKWQRLKDACDAFLEDVKNELTFEEYPKWVNGTVVNSAEDEEKLKAANAPTGEEAAPRPANTQKR